MPLPLRFLFDYISPYAYLAWTQLPALSARYQREIEPVPILFAALLDAWGHKGPAEIPPKRTWVFKNVVRSAHRLGVPLVPPPHHPFNPLLALRVTALPMPVDLRFRLIDRLFQSTWGGGPGVMDPAVVAAIAESVGLDGEKAVAEANLPAAKEQIRQNTEAALKAGAFGVPTLLIGTELFWGLDAFPDVEDYLQGKDPVAPEMLERWSGLTPSAMRKRSQD